MVEGMETARHVHRERRVGGSLQFVGLIIGKAGVTTAWRKQGILCMATNREMAPDISGQVVFPEEVAVITGKAR